MGDVEQAGEVGRDDRIPLALFHLREELVAGDAGVVHQDVDRADFVGDRLDGRLALLVVGDVETVQRDVEAFRLAGFNPCVLGGIAGKTFCRPRGRPQRPGTCRSRCRDHRLRQ